MNTQRRDYWIRLGFLVFAGILWWGWNNIWRSPPFHPQDVSDVNISAHILSLAEYSELIDSHERPYVFKVENDSGAVLFYGAEHTRDPQDPQLADIRDQWDEFDPSIALVEGRLGFLAEGFMDPVQELGEGGLVNKLARDNDVPSYSWELPREDEVALMLKNYPKERVALFYILRPYVSSVRFGKPHDPDAFVEEYIRERTKIPGLEGTFASVEDIDRVWQRDFPGLPDWRDTSDQFGWPGYLGEVADGTNTIRDEHLAKLIIFLVEKGERVFVVAGSAHAVSLDSALHAELGTE
jgi:hypothetical protein